MNETKQATTSDADPSQLFPFDAWLAGRGLTRMTGYRYRTQGLIKTVNVFGRLYITRDEIKSFEQRAIAGEFTKEKKHLSGRKLATA